MDRFINRRKFICFYPWFDQLDKSSGFVSLEIVGAGKIGSAVVSSLSREYGLLPEMGIDDSNGDIFEDGVDIRQRDLLRIESYRYFF